MKIQPTLHAHPKNLDRLALAILHQARLDWQSKRNQGKDSLDLIIFFNSRWFEGLCYLVGRSPDDARRNLRIPRCPALLVEKLHSSKLHADFSEAEICQADRQVSPQQS